MSGEHTKIQPKKIKEARRRIRMRQHDLACLTRVTQGFISRVESGTTRLKPETAERFAVALNVPLEELIK